MSERSPKLFTLLVIAACAFASAACGSDGSTPVTSQVHSEHVTKAQFKGVWPISTDAGILGCDLTKGVGAITFSPDDSTDIYAVNGAAMSWKSKLGWRDFRDIRLPAGTGAGPNMNSSDFDAEGHKVCYGKGTFETN
jgi:hypothetical protein